MKFTFSCRTAALALVVVGLSGCETMQQTVASAREKISSISFSGKPDEPSPSAEVSTALAEQASGCPQVEVVKELSTMHQFMEGGTSRAENEISSIRLVDFDTTCKRNENNVVVDIDARFEGTLGPKAQKWNADHPGFAYPYFVAVTAPNGTIIAKEVFPVTVSFEKGQDRVMHEEHLTHIIPVQGEFGSQQHMLMGFQLTEADLAYNRALLGLSDTHTAETALGQNNPALVFKGDPAVDKTVKKAKPKKVARPASKPATPAPAITAPAPASTETTPAAVVTPVESAPAAPAPVATDPMASPAVADPFAESAPAAMPSETPTSAPDVTPSPSPAPASATTEPAPAAAPNAITSGDAATVPAAPAGTQPADGTTSPVDPTLEDQADAPQPPPLDDGQQSTIDITTPPPGE
jgi:hypothetical protein